MKNLILIICLLISLVGKSQFYCIKIKDGDSFTAVEKNSGHLLEVRLAYVDCPEYGDYNSEASKEFLTRLILHKEIDLTILTFDIYKRLVAEVRTKELYINEEIIKAGQGFVYEQYCEDPKFYQIQSLAKINNLGVWRSKVIVKPWTIRKQRHFKS